MTDASATPVAAPPPKPGKALLLLAKRIGNAGWFLLAWAILLAIWEIGVASGFVNDRILPPPSETIPYLLSGEAQVGFGTRTTGLAESILITLARIVAGLVLGLGTAIAAGILIVEYRPLRRILMPILQSLAPIAPVAWIPFAIALVGIGNPAALFVVFMAIFGAMSCSVVAAFDAVPEDYLKVARSMHASRGRQWLTVILPAAAPSLATMVRMSFFGAWMAVLAGEMAGINSGLGYLIMMGQQMYNMKLVMVGVIAIGAVGFVMDRLLILIQNRLIWWER